VRAVAAYANGSSPTRFAFLLRASWTVLRLSPHQTAGVHVHVSQNFDLVRSLLLVRLARCRRLRAVATIHGSSFVASARRHRRIAERLVRSVDVITALNEETVATVRALGARSVVSVPNPMSLGPTRPREPLRTDTVLFAGDVGRRKGVDTLLAAWPRIRAVHPGARLRLIGPVADPTLVERPPPGIVIEGPRPRAFVRRALEEATVAVLPSRAEALPMFVLEAMAAGVPVVATPVGAVADAIAGAGVVVPVGDDRALVQAISDLLGDPHRAHALGRRGTEKARDDFAAAAIFEKFAQLYASAFRLADSTAAGSQ
jgi:glycosyltransferase involved in cell wall biosynthesis